MFSFIETFTRPLRLAKWGAKVYRGQGSFYKTFLKTPPFQADRILFDPAASQQGSKG